MPLADSLPSAEKASPLGPHGVPMDTAIGAGADKLRGTSWEWVSLRSPTERMDAPDPAKYVITFGADGRVSGTADCNRVLGSYQANATQLRFKGLATTKKACPPGGKGDEFAQRLWFAATYALPAPDTLRIELSAGGGTFTFHRAK